MDATFGSEPDDREMAASVYDEPKADEDFDPDSDDMGMGQDEQ